MTTTHPFGRTVDTLARLREILPAPAPDAISMIKVLDHMDVHVRRFIENSPYALVASASPEGFCDASPRGGDPGFIRVLDDRHLLIPEATGNRRADTLANLVANPYIGMLFLIPGYEETLRLNGRVFITEDPAVLAGSEMINGKPPALGIGIRVEECFLHCAKAAMRSSIWNPMGWPDLDVIPTAAEMFVAHTGSRIGDGSVKDVQMLLNDSYTNRL
ncbi:MSMEG_1061 family FMN-dependent PPOX-type flavoprotein [Xylophilus sp. GOD-11R]|uniref:MSMEG_1061 family FMN-dependent PPOX-type flavoprotein n=1 Tax=Xylophilus sp. GOD-11R TaxID=3089814 RepID=UPI00298CEA6E|nr:MSMEG_1061 family FMN-dependent PPOX-type flavoprotein [Xylophilus sp. GOD-11R]WPB57250.1 pyridoxamine 5'-phosphate oxidase family protein [Xylophilus sp. GOD-11R]